MLLRFQLPLPSQKLRSNGSFGNAFVYREAKREAKAAAVAEAERVLRDFKIKPPKWGRARAVITQYHVHAKRMDPDNLIHACKMYLDGLRDAGIVRDDNDLFPEARFIRVTEKPRVEIVIGPESYAPIEE